MQNNIKLVCNEVIRIDEFLRKALPDVLKSEGLEAGKISNSKIRRLILSGAVSVNNRECRRPAFELRGRSNVAINFDVQKFFFEKQPDDIEFEVTDNSVLYEDENLIFINKPSFFPVEQTITGNRKNLHDAVVDYLWKKNPSLRNPPYVGIMHRLDKETSGVILFTKKRDANKPVHDMFEQHSFKKIYTAVCCTKNNYKIGQKFTVEKFIGRISGKSNAAKWGTLSEKNGGLFSKTDFTVTGKKLYNGKNYLVVECDLFTGRTHQIRVHLSEAGLPLLGDELYGGDSADRIYLHAKRMKSEEGLIFDVSANEPWS